MHAQRLQLTAQHRRIESAHDDEALSAETEQEILYKEHAWANMELKRYKAFHGQLPVRLDGVKKKPAIDVLPALEESRQLRGAGDRQLP